jgi:FAD/FMN-containing dehydrogenase
MTRVQTFNRRGFLTMAMATGVAATGTARAVASSFAADRAVGVDWTALRKALDGPLIRPGDSGYASAAMPFNAALGVRSPAAIAQVASRADVATCVRRVRGHGIPIAARSGGHSYAGFSTPDQGLVVDLAGLHKITVKSNGTAVIGAGAKLIDVYSALAAHGRALPAGSCPTVGIAGSTLGGGIGVLARAYGLSCDHLQAATVISADGDAHTVNSAHNSDLLWALRGGGGGNGGIVTSFTFSTVPAPTVRVFSLQFPAVRTARVLQAWSTWMKTAPDRLTSLCHVTAAATPTNRITGTWTGSASGLSAQLAAFIAEVGVDPTSRRTHTYKYVDAMRYFAGCLSKSLTACHPASVPGGTLGRESFRAASRMVERSLTATTAGTIVELMRGQRGMVLLFDSLGGKVGDISPSATAFVHRKARASVQVYAGSATSGAAVLAVQNALASVVGTGSYVNYLNPEQVDWGKAYYGSNLPRLRKVIKKYDPDGVFTFAQSVLKA